jgi:hypothetical protein
MSADSQIALGGSINILQLADEFRAAQAQCEQMMQSSLHVAHRLGSALALAEETLEQGQFTILLEHARVDRPMAKKLVRFAKDTSAESLTGSFRQGMLELGFVPKKEREKDAGDKTVRMLPHISAAVAAWSRFAYAVEVGHLEMDRAAIIAETREMYKWLKEIHGGENG